MKVVSFFSGCGGLDLGFEQAGYEVIWANEFDESIQSTYEFNHPSTFLCKSDIRTLKADDIPYCDGFIGGPPCQAWSEAGQGLGLQDERGEVFLDYIRLIKDKQPKFFLIENVKGLICDAHLPVFKKFMTLLYHAGYKIQYKLLDAVNFRVPQNRERVFIVGIRNDITNDYCFPKSESKQIITLKEAIGNIKDCPNEFTDLDIIAFNNDKILSCQNNDVYKASFSTRYMARNRVRKWNEPSFTIPASASNVPIHPQAPKMDYISANLRAFHKGSEFLYRRLSVRECARIQTFPDNFKFLYSNIKSGYKMVGNAVPPRLAKCLAESLKKCFENDSTIFVLVGYYKSAYQLSQIRNNHLYYIRRGDRYGAIRINDSFPIVDYIILHDMKHEIYFSVQKERPLECDDEFLRKKGFNPKGNEYWVFRLKEELRNVDNLSEQSFSLTKMPQIIQIVRK